MGKKLNNEVSIHKNGRTYLSEDIFKKLGEPLKVKIFVNDVNKMIVLVPTNEDGDDIFKINQDKYFLSLEKIYYILGYAEAPSGRKNIDFCDDSIIIYLRKKD